MIQYHTLNKRDGEENTPMFSPLHANRTPCVQGDPLWQKSPSCGFGLVHVVVCHVV